MRCCCAPDAANRETSTRRAFIRLPLKVIPVEVEFDGSSILSVHVLSHSETVNISDRAIDELPSQIVEAQTWDVDAVSSATFTSDAIREAVRDCLAQAALR